MSNKKNAPQRHIDAMLAPTVPFEYAEAYKALRTNYKFAAMNGKNKKIIVTSSLPDEGKTTIAINLAISLAENQAKVLLIERDLRNPSVQRILRMRLSAANGVSTLLTGTSKVNDCLCQTEHGFDFIPAGPIPPNPVELLTSKAMQSLMETTAKYYDYIICDAPPVGIVTDAAALCPICDGVLFVIKQNHANRSQVKAALQNLKSVNANILGTVLSQYDVRKDAAKNYGNYRGNYGSYYGSAD